METCCSNTKYCIEKAECPLFIALFYCLGGEFLVAEFADFIVGQAESVAALLFVGIEVAFAPVNVSIAFEG